MKIDPNVFFEAYKYLEEKVQTNSEELWKEKHIGSDSLDTCLSIMVAKINPKTRRIEEDEKLNTEVEVWLEFGFQVWDKNFNTVLNSHDYRLDVGASTFEEAIIKLARKVKKYYK